MCGVIGLVCERTRSDLGIVAGDLLRQLEYRGYDSTGAAIQGDDLDVVLKKGVGAPSAVVKGLGIDRLGGRVFCGQVRWATFGAVDEVNAQPHVVRCHTFLYGAHNGNVTNCDELKAWLGREGHAVRSDNDGEMVVHTVEHFFAQQLAADARRATDPEQRRACMRLAIRAAAARLRGSYAAIVVDPVTRVLWSIKQGSSLYFGVGRDEAGGAFTLSSSDLSAVLKRTRLLVPLAEGEFVEHDAEGVQVFGLKDDGGPRERRPVRSRLRAQDTALSPPFTTFMEQEIDAQERTCGDVVRLHGGGSETLGRLRPLLDGAPDDLLAEVHGALEELRGEATPAGVRERFRVLAQSRPMAQLLQGLDRDARRRLLAAEGKTPGDRLASAEAGLLSDLMPACTTEDDRLALRLLDAVLEREEVAEFQLAADRFARLVDGAAARGARVYVVCCGSSYNATLAAGLFFNEVARVQVLPLLPGEFRGRCSRTLQDGDVLVAVSQSGETKDLIDVLNDVAASGRQVVRIGVVNNVNSTLAQEKSDLVIPLRCGPEVAVAATKSFLNQMAVFLSLALRVARLRLADPGLDDAARAAWADELEGREQRFRELPALIRATLTETRDAVESAAALLHLAPSMHILATRLLAVAREGALKVREVVLNHTEGFEASEFKHGPNTILGWNTVLGPEHVRALLDALTGSVRLAVMQAHAGGAESAARAAADVLGGVFSGGEASLGRGELFRALDVAYPLVYVTGPDERDVQLTVSQINTHKIRGALTLIIAEDHPDLRQAASKAPANQPGYRHAYIALPPTGDPVMTAFSAVVVLQRLALSMSLRKARFLDALGVPGHGVHPDVPKNVSKSITVD